MDWPARSPDLNPIENVWGMLARKVYEGGRQNSNTKELKQQIENSWYDLDVGFLQKLIKSMSTRIFNMIRSNGKSINY